MYVIALHLFSANKADHYGTLQDRLLEMDKDIQHRFRYIYIYHLLLYFDIELFYVITCVKWMIL